MTVGSSVVLAVMLGLADGCSSGDRGSLISCVAPGSPCCAGNACAVGLACQSSVCAAVDAGAAIDGAPGDGGMGDGG